MELSRDFVVDGCTASVFETICWQIAESSLRLEKDIENRCVLEFSHREGRIIITNVYKGVRL